MTALRSHQSDPRDPRDRPALGLSDVADHLVQVRHHELLTADQEIALARRIAQGDREARDELITRNLRLTVWVAKRYVNRGLDLPDLIQAGMVGLITAADRFNPDFGCRFTTYATYWVKMRIEKALKNEATLIHVPHYLTAPAQVWCRTAADLASEAGREPEPEAVAASLGLSPHEAELVHAAALAFRTIHQEAAGDQTRGGSLLPLDQIAVADPEPDHSDEADLSARVVRLIRTELPEREREILTLRYGLDGEGCRTLEHIGHRYGITKERIRQLEASALARLRHKIHADRHRIVGDAPSSDWGCFRPAPIAKPLPTPETYYRHFTPQVRGELLAMIRDHPDESDVQIMDRWCRVTGRYICRSTVRRARARGYRRAIADPERQEVAR